MAKTVETPRCIRVGDLTIHVIERTRVSGHEVGERLWLEGWKDFTSIVVEAPGGTRKFTLDEIDIAG